MLAGILFGRCRFCECLFYSFELLLAAFRNREGCMSQHVTVLKHCYTAFLLLRWIQVEWLQQMSAPYYCICCISCYKNHLMYLLFLDCLRSFTDLEELDETELYMCHKCKKKQKSTKKFWIQKLPKVCISMRNNSVAKCERK